MIEPLGSIPSSTASRAIGLYGPIRSVAGIISMTALLVSAPRINFHLDIAFKLNLAATNVTNFYRASTESCWSERVTDTVIRST